MSQALHRGDDYNLTRFCGPWSGASTDSRIWYQIEAWESPSNPKLQIISLPKSAALRLARQIIKDVRLPGDKG